MLGVGYRSTGTECDAMGSCLWASWCFLNQKRAGAKLQRQTLLSSGDTVYKHKDRGHLRASALTKYNHQRKKEEEIKHFFCENLQMHHP